MMVKLADFTKVIISGFNVTFVASDSMFEDYEVPAGALYPDEHHDEDHLIVKKIMKKKV